MALHWQEPDNAHQLQTAQAWPACTTSTCMLTRNCPWQLSDSTVCFAGKSCVCSQPFTLPANSLSNYMSFACAKLYAASDPSPAKQWQLMGLGALLVLLLWRSSWVAQVACMPLDTMWPSWWIVSMLESGLACACSTAADVAVVAPGACTTCQHVHNKQLLSNTSPDYRQGTPTSWQCSKHWCTCMLL